MPTLQHLISASAAETEAFGKAFGETLHSGDIVLLRGDLGAGKTSFTGGLVQAFGIPREAVSSPTFAIMNRYDGRLPVYHFDLYRLRNAAEARNAGVEEFAGNEGITVIEWPEIAGALIDPPYYMVELTHGEKGTRTIVIQAVE
jgi:tRNA threonylcarbamoyladenosine biosynthesis protein TsaE